MTDENAEAARDRATKFGWSVAIGLLLLSLVMGMFDGCGADNEDAPGPDVRGMALPDAKAELKAAGVESTVHADDVMLGVIIEENFIVCSIETVNERMVRLEVAKRGC